LATRRTSIKIGSSADIAPVTPHWLDGSVKLGIEANADFVEVSLPTQLDGGSGLDFDDVDKISNFVEDGNTPSDPLGSLYDDVALLEVEVPIPALV